MAVFGLSTYTFLAYLPLLFAAYLVGLGVYRKTLHPLAKIPGPFLASVTYLYQTYYGLVAVPKSRFYDKIDKLHKIYGPVVRITPNEIHLSDPENYERINYVGTKFAKSAEFYDGFAIQYSTFATSPNEVHAIRRGALNPLFSRKRVLALEGVVQDKVDKLIRRTLEAKKKGVPMDVHHAFRAVSVDVISDYGFGQSYDLLDAPDLGKNFFEMIQGLGPVMWIFQQFPFLRSLAPSTPKWFADLVSAPLSHMMAMQMECIKQVQAVKDKMDAGKIDPDARITIFQHLLTPGIVDGYVVPTVPQIKDESYSIVAAAADTTGNAMAVACFNICSQPDVYKKLVEELTTTFPDDKGRLDFLTLEKLPYLTGVVKEALRLSFGVPGRLPREVPESGATFNGYSVPAGTIVGMSSWVMHRNEDIFPDAMKFDPERWLNIERARYLDKYIVAFGKGTRQCVGMPLAYCELYCTIGRFFRRYPNLRVFNTTRKDMEYEDYFTGYNPLESRKLHVTVE